MEQKVEEFQEIVENENTEVIAEYMKDFADFLNTQTSEEIAQYSLDEVICAALKKIAEKDLLYLIIEPLEDIILLMRDPRNVYSILEKFFKKEFLVSIEVAKIFFLMKKNFGFQLNDFYTELFECLTVENIQENIEKKLMFILSLFEDCSLPLSVIKAYIKKLCKIALLTDSICATKIIWTVLWIMRMHPITYSMVKTATYDLEYEWTETVEIGKLQPYLFELDILEESIPIISKTVKLIKKESEDLSSRPKVVSLEEFIFPNIQKL